MREGQSPLALCFVNEVANVLTHKLTLRLGNHKHIRLITCK